MENKFKNIMAFTIMIFGFLAITALIIMGGVNGTTDNLLNVILPLIATWVGTVIAYYFSKENFEAANKSISNMISTMSPFEKLKKMLSKDVMIPYERIIKHELKDNERKEDILLTNLLKIIQDKNMARIPVFNSDKSISLIIHRSMIDFLVSTNQLSANPKDIKALTVKDMMDNSEIKNVLNTSIATVKEDSTLADAKSAMDNEPKCKDVFVTPKGGKSEPVLGWITDNDIVKHSVV